MFRVTFFWKEKKLRPEQKSYYRNQFNLYLNAYAFNAIFNKIA